MRYSMNIKDVATPSYIVDEGKLKSNLEILKSVIDRTGCRILLAQKCFSMYAVYQIIGEYISGCTASGLFEARLGITIETVSYTHLDVYKRQAVGISMFRRKMNLHQRKLNIQVVQYNRNYFKFQ